MLTWLHLSDLHLTEAASSKDRAHFDRLLDDIRTICRSETFWPDVVFFTGDVAFSAQRSQYELAAQWFDEVLEACSLTNRRDRLFVIPGNHDVDRNIVNRSHMSLKQHVTWAEDLLSTRECKDVDDFLKCELDRKWDFEKFVNYGRFIETYYNNDDIRFDNNRYYFVRPIEKDGVTVMVIGLNSTWLSFRNNEQGQLLLGEVQVCDALQRLNDPHKKPNWCIALTHHPLYWLAEKDINCIQKHLPGKCHILLHGHVHHSSFSIQSNPDSYLHVFGAGASLKSQYHAYNLVRLNLTDGKGTAIVRFQHDDIQSNWGPDSLTYRNAQNGKIAFSLNMNHLWPPNGAASEA